MNIGIAGAGLVGRLLAFLLSGQGHQVSVFDPAPDVLAHNAAGFTAAGMLSHIAELETGNDQVFAYGVRSLQLWKQIVALLTQPVDLHYQGSLLLAHAGDEGAAERLVSLLRIKAPEHEQPTPLSAEELAQLEPDVQPMAQRWLLHDEGHINTHQAMASMAASAQGVQWHWGRAITRVTPHTLHAEQTRYPFDWVFDARGVGMREFPFKNPLQVDCRNVRGVRGETYHLQLEGLRLQRPIRLLHPRYRVYIVPRRDGRIVVGASEIESEDRSPVSLRTTVELLAAAHSVLPALAESRIIHTEVNLRPSLADHFPRIENEEGMTRINGLFRHGWLMGPAVVEDALQQAGMGGPICPGA